MNAYLSVLGVSLGVRTPITEVPDIVTAGHLDVLHAEGLAFCRVTNLNAMELAASVTPGAPGGPPQVAPVDLALVCTDSADHPDMTRWLVDYQLLTGLESTRTILVSGSACANTITAMDMARGLLACGSARRILGVTADRAASSRYLASGQSVLSDGAASWLMTRTPGPRSFELLGVTGETRCLRTTHPLSQARSLIRAVQQGYDRLRNDLDQPSRYLVLPHLGKSSRDLLTMAVGSGPDRRYDAPVADLGHCFAADPLLDLAQMQQEGALDDGDQVLVVASAAHTAWLAALRFAAN
ncbi:hypothetical protein GCM10022225_07770 [Plantactinospora mayteni]|uniref:3-oxoacyl-ACP synthase n=1 Tax=Plantactinospora mayteni TaxID=566021 RepID=A0ABQ4EIC5_9ACTN|nr:hypothetical protein [Plantactinospora mayteni]GIG94477.1 hypothetical protein Pma05_10500 [Plantactinospora mayteni]